MRRLDQEGTVEILSEDRQFPVPGPRPELAAESPF